MMRHAEFLAEENRLALEALSHGEHDLECSKQRRLAEMAMFAFGNGLMALLEDADGALEDRVARKLLADDLPY